MTVKQTILDVYYKAQIGFTALGWLLSIAAYTSIVILALHFLVPNLPSAIIYVITIVGGFIFFFVVGHIFLTKGGYEQSQAFGNRRNPFRLNWEMELTKAGLVIEECNIIIKIAKQQGIDTSAMDKRILELEDVKKDMEKLLGKGYKTPPS